VSGVGVCVVGFVDICMDVGDTVGVVCNVLRDGGVDMTYDV
jgi:hypothetical protein